MIRFGSKLGLAATVAAIGLFAGEARALFLVQVTSTLTAPSGGSVSVGGSTVTLQRFTDQPADVDLSVGSNPVHETYGTTIVNGSPSGMGDSFTGANAINYAWTLTFTHVVNGVATGATSTITGITGTISGLVSSNGSTLTNSYTGSPSQTAPVSIVVDGRTISVLLDAYTPPGTPPDIKNDFSVSLQAQAVPEPTTIALMGVGGLMLIAPYLRRKARLTA